MPILQPKQMQTQTPMQQLPNEEEQALQDENRSPQDSFDQFVINGLKILHLPEKTKSMIKQIQLGKDKIESIGMEALDIVTRLEGSAEGSNFNITANTVLNGLNVIVGEIINIMENAGMEPLNDEQKYQAFSWAFSNYINNAVNEGKISKEELIQLGEQMKQQQQEGGGAMPEEGIPPEQVMPPQQTGILNQQNQNMGG